MLVMSKLLTKVIQNCAECPYYYCLDEAGQVFHGCKNVPVTNGVLDTFEVTLEKIPDCCPLPTWGNENIVSYGTFVINKRPKEDDYVVIDNFSGRKRVFGDMEDVHNWIINLLKERKKTTEDVGDE